MQILAKIQDFFAQLFAESGVAEPHASSPKLSDDPIAQTDPHNQTLDDAIAEVEVRRSDLPDMPYELPRQKLAPDMPEPTDPR